MSKTVPRLTEDQAIKQRPDQLIDQFLSEKLTATLAELTHQAWQTDGTEMPKATYDRLKYFHQLREALATLTQSEGANPLRSVYLISSSFLRDAFRAVTKTRNEDLVYVTGPEDGKRLFALTRLVTFNLAERSIAHAIPEHRSQLRALMRLDKSEERLLATFHSHPGKGARATKPSPTDMSTQHGLEKNGYPAIGAIFSRDGYVRFYSANRLFRVAMSGARIAAEQADDNLFRICDIEPRLLSRFARSHPRSLVRNIDSHAKSMSRRRSE